MDSPAGTPGTPSQDKLVVFLKDILRLGCLRGFKYFSLYLRGREELLVTINTTQYACDWDGGPNGLFTAIKDGLPPASPSARDQEEKQENAVFLIGSYARYKCPYVWLRSNHSHFLRGKTPNKDLPLKLASVANWKHGAVKAWEVIAELVFLALHDDTVNPFAVDHQYFDSIPKLERSLHTGALASFLRRIYTSEFPYSAMVFEDLQFVLTHHFFALPQVIADTPAGESDRDTDIWAPH